MPGTIVSRIWIEGYHEAPELIELSNGDACIFSRRSPEKETLNEDGALLAHLERKETVLAVADGCGGMAGGRQAAQITLDELSDAIVQALGHDTSLRAAILDGIEKANARVLALGTGAAATLAVAEVGDRGIRPYHVGDAQILLVGNRGKVKLHTCAHSPVGYAVEAGLLSETEAIHHEERHVVSNVVGARDGHIEIGAYRAMAPRDTLLLASDGVFDNLQLEEIIEVIRKGSLERAASALADAVFRRMATSSPGHPSKPDDTTFVLFRLRRRGARR